MMRPLPPMPPAAADSMLAALRRRGFARVPLRRRWIREALAYATSRDAAELGGFRFPPMDGGPIAYTESRRAAFRALFEVATHCLDGLLSSAGGGGDDDEEASSEGRAALSDALLRARGGGEGDGEGCRFGLFRNNDHEPFEAGAPFAQSFFNLFNYDHGSLNAHVDRSLLTVIYSCGSADGGTASTPRDDVARSGTSALWIKDGRGAWRNADRAVRPDEAVVMVGEDLEECGIASSLGLFAAEHAVRVDPTGDRIERSHFRRDPSCAEGVSNRLSAALILRHESR